MHVGLGKTTGHLNAAARVTGYSKLANWERSVNCEREATTQSKRVNLAIRANMLACGR